MNRRTFLAHAGAGAAAAAPNPDRPNILFVLSDQYRYDALGANGNSEVHTPELDHLAASGVRFEHCYAAQALCTPSRASIMTGKYPHSHGLQENVYRVPDAFSMGRYRLRPNLPESFGAAGYRTGYIGKWHLGEQNPGFFDHWNAFNSLKPHWLGKPHESVYRNDADTEDALQFLAANRANPFLLFVSYYPPHTPYTAPRRFHGFYEGKNLQPMEYYAAASNVSWNIGRLREQLSKLGLDRRTCVVFSTDHGETFGRRPGSKNKRVCYDDSARIPLLMSLPGRLAAGLAWRSGVSNVDIMPTLLGIAGLKPVRSADGRNLFPRILAREDRWTGPVVIQNITQPLPDGATAVERAIRTERWKLIIKQPVSRPREYVYELYDMNSDPGESRNLFDAGHARTAGYLANELAAWASRFRDPLAAAFAAECIRGLPA